MDRRQFTILAAGAAAAAAAGIDTSGKTMTKGTVFASNPTLPTLKSGFQGTPKVGKEFQDLYSAKRAGFGDMSRWVFGSNPQRKEKSSDTVRPQRHSPTAADLVTPDSITWLGHSSLLIRMGGLGLLIDPVVSFPFSDRYSDPVVNFADLTGLDFVLVSHGHMDHLDTETIASLEQPGLRALAPLGMSQLLTDANENLEVQEAGWWQRYSLPNGVEITFVPSQHWHRRTPWDFNQVLWGGFYIKAGGTSIYFPGDTAYCNCFREIRETLGAPDICILPVGAYKPDFVMKTSHTSPDEAVQAFADLGGKVLVPCHWGTFDLSDEPPGEPLRRLLQLQQEGKIAGKLHIAALGKPMAMVELLTL